METIKLRYTSNDEGETKTVEIEKEAPNGLHDYEVCELFADFMQAVGFSEKNVLKYFRE